ncbi:hypothetical protein ACFL2D_01970, partial [Patescibacteria group bacterium]
GDHDINLVDGLRMPLEIDTMKQIPDFKLIYITAPQEIRHKFLNARQEKADDQMTFEKFKEIEAKAAPEMHVPELGKRAEFKIENTGTIEELHTKIDDVMQEILKK